MKYKFIVTGGGTSGHINPAITIADALKKYYEGKGDSCDIIFTGRAQGLEGELVPKAGYEFRSIEAKPFPMKPSPRMVKAYMSLRRGQKQCLKIIDEFAPDAVIGTGGYVCPPLLMAAFKKKVPVIIHEANAFPGRANKMIGKKADLVLTGFPDQEKDFKGAKEILFTGNPIRSMVFDAEYETSRKNIGVSSGEKLVFAMGGSLGSKTINDFVIEAAKRPEFADIKFVLSAGKQQSGKIIESGNIPSNLEIREYIDNPQDYLLGADVAITRAGAVTCAEAAAVGSCSVFIPYPHAAHDHQTYNASAFVDVGGAIMVPDQDVVEGKLFSILADLLSDKSEAKRKSLRENAKKLAAPDCDEKIVTAINKVINK